MKKIIIVLTILIFSCTPLYVPNSRNAPMFRQRGEFQTSGAIGNGIEVQAAYALTNHLGIVGNALFLDRKISERFYFSNSGTNIRHTFFEGGIGYFKNYETTVFEMYAGYGRGDCYSDDDSFFSGGSWMSGTGKYNRFFILPEFAVNKTRWNIFFAPRFSAIDFTEFNPGSGNQSVAESPVFLFEPSVGGRLNLVDDRIMINGQAGFSDAIGGDRYFKSSSLSISAGIGFRLAPNVTAN
jgi:hypothetical protein